MFWGQDGFAKLSAEPGYDLGLTDNNCWWAVPAGWKAAADLGLSGTGPVPNMRSAVAPAPSPGA